jgi:hypothetical protein
MFSEKGLTLRPLVLPMAANIKIKCVWSICGVIKSDKNRSIQRRICPSATFRPQIFTRVDSGPQTKLHGVTLANLCRITQAAIRKLLSVTLCPHTDKKLKVTLEQAMKAQKGSRSIALLFLKSRR